ncbi:MAG: SDR family NAD(P)-dependent oxidoreductase, partial [Proteobacteria bacterium]|nr:SDR family NAD(P)-dependent oxidoreductase [Pseudomonadota bacterium]
PGLVLALTGRHEERLASIAGQCRERGARVATAALDVTDAAALEKWIAAMDAVRPLDLVIANAGISGGTDKAAGGEGASQARRIFAVNLHGVINTVMPAIALMRARGRGQIALMSSLAGFRGFPGAPAYCASKAAVKAWGESLRGSLARDGIAVSVICPGFVRSPMTDVNPFPMPLLMETRRAAALIKRRLARNHGRIAFPWPMYLLVWLIAALPPLLTDRLLARMPEKTKLPEAI